MRISRRGSRVLTLIDKFQLQSVICIVYNYATQYMLNVRDVFTTRLIPRPASSDAAHDIHADDLHRQIMRCCLSLLYLQYPINHVAAHARSMHEHPSSPLPPRQACATPPSWGHARLVACLQGRARATVHLN